MPNTKSGHTAGTDSGHFLCDECDQEALLVWLIGDIRVCGDCKFKEVRKQWLVEAWRTWTLEGDPTIETMQSE